MHELAETVVAEEPAKGWITDNPSVDFTVWDHGRRRTIYLLNTDWKSRHDGQGSLPETHYGTQSANLVLGNYKFSLDVRRYHLETIHCAEGLAVLPSANTTDVLAIQPVDEGWRVSVQTTGADTFRCMQQANGKDSIVKVDKSGITELLIKK